MRKTQKLTRNAVFSAANGMLFMTFFGVLWAVIGLIGLHGWGSPWLLIITIMISFTLLMGAISLLKASRRFSNQQTETEAKHWKRVNRWFVIIFALEGVAIGIASVITNVLNHFEMFFPIMAIIVGIHFFPLAPLFKVKTHYVTGALLCILGIITLFFVPTEATIGGHTIIASSALSGFGSALILWGNGLTTWLTTKRWLSYDK